MNCCPTHALFLERFVFPPSCFMEALKGWNSHHHRPQTRALVVYKFSHLVELWGRVKQDAYNSQRKDKKTAPS